MSEVTRDQVVEAAKSLAGREGGPFSRADFERLTSISQYHIYRFFPEGGWSEVKTLAGLERHPKDNEPQSDGELLEEFHRVASAQGDIPTWAAFSSTARVSADVIRKRFGGLHGTLKKYRSWLEEREPQSPLLAAIHARSRHEIPAPPNVGVPLSSPQSQSTQWPRARGPEFGSPLDFRGLRHAPINEQGVVFLFGMVAYELGFIVEAVYAAFPDCEAKRCVDRRGDRWQRVRVEFEFRSSNFLAHGHDPAACDMIVCWEHDWQDFPLEVVELRTVIDQLEG